MDFITKLINLSQDLTNWFTDFVDSLSSPIANVVGPTNSVLVGVLNNILGLFGTDIYTTPFITFILGLGVSFFVLFHFVKFIVGLFT